MWAQETAVPAPPGDREPLPRAHRVLDAVFDAVLGAVVPSRCAACRAPRRDVGGGGVCADCWRRIDLARPGNACSVCALPGAPQGGTCRACAAHRFPFERAAAVGPYEGELARVVAALKFRGWDLLAEPAGERMAAAAHAAGLAADADALVPVPSTGRRNRERGYDPADLLARSAARRLGRPVVPLLKRVRDTGPQSRLPASRREANVAGAFASVSGTRARTILLVDDVLTTGATAASAARTLLDAGASRVAVLVLARTPDPETSLDPETA